MVRVGLEYYAKKLAFTTILSSVLGALHARESHMRLECLPSGPKRVGRWDSRSVDVSDRKAYPPPPVNGAPTPLAFNFVISPS